MILPSGKFVSRIRRRGKDVFVEGASVVSVPLIKEKTLYRAGEKIFIFGILLIVFAGSLKRKEEGRNG